MTLEGRQYLIAKPSANKADLTNPDHVFYHDLLTISYIIDGFIISFPVSERSVIVVDL